MNHMTSDAERQLLFGLVALRNGLIDQDQLITAFQAWARAKERTLAEHLGDRGNLDAGQRGVIEAMVGLHVKKHDGDVEKSLASIAAGTWTREQLTILGDPELTATVAHLAADSDSTQPGDDVTARYRVSTATGDGQRYRVLRPHARGGLGAVFVALDGELHREVALKQILDAHADDEESRRRFLLEAEITGGLEHPGIVPVYGLGSYGDGRPYYAMRFIRGDSLKDAITQFHTDEALATDPGRRSLERARCYGGSPTSATRSTTHTAAASCIEISSRATSSSASTAKHWSSTGGSPSHWVGSSPAAMRVSGP